MLPVDVVAVEHLVGDGGEAAHHVVAVVVRGTSVPCQRHTTMGVAQISQSATQHTSSSWYQGVMRSAAQSRQVSCRSPVATADERTGRRAPDRPWADAPDRAQAGHAGYGRRHGAPLGRIRLRHRPRLGRGPGGARAPLLVGADAVLPGRVRPAGRGRLRGPGPRPVRRAHRRRPRPGPRRCWPRATWTPWPTWCARACSRCGACRRRPTRPSGTVGLLDGGVVGLVAGRPHPRPGGRDRRLLRHAEHRHDPGHVARSSATSPRPTPTSTTTSAPCSRPTCTCWTRTSSSTTTPAPATGSSRRTAPAYDEAAAALGLGPHGRLPAHPPGARRSGRPARSGRSASCPRRRHHDVVGGGAAVRPRLRTTNGAHGVGHRGGCGHGHGGALRSAAAERRPGPGGRPASSVDARRAGGQGDVDRAVVDAPGDGGGLALPTSPTGAARPPPGTRGRAS